MWDLSTSEKLNLDEENELMNIWEKDNYVKTRKAPWWLILGNM